MEEKLKNILKHIKLNESTFSMLLGLGVVLVIGSLVVNYFRNKPAELPNFEDQQEIVEDVAEKEEYAEVPAAELPPFEGELPVIYRVREGDNLWKIAERYYQTGYGWVEIAEVNNLQKVNVLEKDQELTIPQLSKAYPLTIEVTEPATGGSELTITEETTEGQELALLTENDAEVKVDGIHTEKLDRMSQYGGNIEGDKYLVARGDHLWGIADRAYGDPFRWVEIAEANNLENPSLIFAGNELVLPR